MPQDQTQPAEIPQEAIAKFHSLTPEQRTTALSRMTPELKSRFLPAAQEYRAMHAPDSAYPAAKPEGPTPTTAGKVFDKVAQFSTRNAPMIAGGIGGVAGGAVGGLPGAVAGAGAGGAYGSAIKSKTEQGSVKGKEVAKGAAEQAALELGGGLAAKGLAKTASLLEVDEALMKFALKRGEDFERDLNPAAMMNKYHLHDMTTKGLYQKTAQKIGSLSKAADAMIDQVNDYSSTVRPYAVIKGVIDKAKSKASSVADQSIKDSMDQMLDGIQKEFGPTGASSRSETLMTPKEANALKQQWGETVPWGKGAPKNELEAVHAARTAVKRDIYHALDDSIADAMGGNQGKAWRATNHDIFNLMEAKGALQEAGERTASDARGILPTILDSMRKPGIASEASRAVSPAAAQMLGSTLPTLGRGALTAGNEVLNPPQQNPIPLPAK